MNAILRERLDGILRVLLASFDGSKSLSSSTKGSERETFINLFLHQTLPPMYRFGSGDITDSRSGAPAVRSGQIDIVIEMPWAPSFATPVGSSFRLYPAEAVGVAIEVKSDVENQWKEVLGTAQALAPLRQKLNGIVVKGNSLTVVNETLEPVPLYAVGYKGWSTDKTVRTKVAGASIDGLLVLESQIFAWSDRKSFLRRLNLCETELEKKKRGEPFDLSQATCAYVFEIAQSESVIAERIAQLNSELWCIQTELTFSDEVKVSPVPPGSWTQKLFDDFVNEFGKKIDVLTGTEALLKFVSVIHGEVGKRAAMSFDLDEYGA